MYKNTYEEWKSKAKERDIIDELACMSDDEIKEYFTLPLTFGTAGMRGTIGAGINRMNVYTVGLITRSLANYLLKRNVKPKVVIGYDNRKNSKRFAVLASEILAFAGVKVFIFKNLIPTPIVSFATREMHADAAIMITASHNPKDYNGYKVFSANGSQIGSAEANEIANVEGLSYFDIEKLNFDAAISSKQIEYISEKIYKKYIKICKKVRFYKPINDLKIIYTPLNGTGFHPVTDTLTECGYTNLQIPSSQKNPSENFETCPTPNPEFESTFDECIKMTKDFKADIIVATDPDCDRIGAMILKDGQYHFLSGNEIGLLLLFYIFTNRRLKKNSFIVNSVVTSPMAEILCKKFGVKCYHALTGFKNIAVMIDEKLKQKEKFVFAYEESNGYMAHLSIRDKDGVASTLMLVEMCALYNSRSINIIDLLEKIKSMCGNLLDVGHSTYYKGIDGANQMQQKIDFLRKNPLKKIAGVKVELVTDYLLDDTGLEKSNFITYNLADNQRVIVRPSGTEPKLKFYISAKSNELATKFLTDMQTILK